MGARFAQNRCGGCGEAAGRPAQNYLRFDATCRGPVAFCTLRALVHLLGGQEAFPDDEARRAPRRPPASPRSGSALSISFFATISGSPGVEPFPSRSVRSFSQSSICACVRSVALIASSMNLRSRVIRVRYGARGRRESRTNRGRPGSEGRGGERRKSILMGYPDLHARLAETQLVRSGRRRSVGAL